ncbi:MFS transporter [Phenylobacterium sp.]|uniref:MFS transporter n=1 Tax=Phenylobacterium sp. TaxID=1871053 RepID=UPI002EDA5291
MSHPYVELLRDRHVRVLWVGLALSALGGELYRVGALWLAAELAGPNASLLVTASSAAVLAVSILGGPMAEALPRRGFLIGADVLAALACAAVVVAATASGLTFPLLVAISVLLGLIGGAHRPVLLASVPSLTPPGELRAANGLFDSTIRVAQAGGPFLAAAVMSVLPAIHLLTANAVSFLASAGALAAVGRRLDAPRDHGPKPGFFRRLARGVHAANACPGVWSALITTGVRGGSYALGFTVAVPLIFAESDGASGLAGVAIVFGAAAAAELLAGPLVVLTDPKRPLRRQFEGYVVIGVAQALIGAAAMLPPGVRLAAMVAPALVMGVAHAVAGLQMLTFFSTRLSSDDYAAVLRLRLVLVIGAMMATTAIGPFVLPALGPAMTAFVCGLVAAATALVGLFGRPARSLGPGFRPLASQD